MLASSATIELYVIHCLLLVFVKPVYIVTLVTGVKTVFDICIHLACIKITECFIVLDRLLERDV